MVQLYPRDITDRRLDEEVEVVRSTRGLKVRYGDERLGVGATQRQKDDDIPVRGRYCREIYPAIPSRGVQSPCMEDEGRLILRQLDMALEAERRRSAVFELKVNVFLSNEWEYC